MAKGTTIGQAYVQILPSAEGIQGKLTSILNQEAGSAGLSAGSALSGALGKALTGLSVAGAVKAVWDFGSAAVDAGKQFDSAMSQVAATMGVTTGEIGELRDYAQQMGASTAFSATEAAEALNYMALAGYDAQTSMEMLPNVLNLAAAGGIELGRASDMVTDAQSALGLSLGETTELVDMMAAASSRSNTSVAQLGDAILTIGGTANTLSGGTLELATALGILADNGIKGAEGGTHLRNVILSLSAPTDVAAAALESLGVQTSDASGDLRSLEDIMADLGASLDGLGAAEKAQIISTIFNKTDIASVNALLNTSADRWEELGAAIEDSAGAAQAMADTQLDNLAGDITLFESALEGAKIALSDKLTPALRGMVGLGTEALSWATDLLSPMSEIEQAIGKIETAQEEIGKQDNILGLIDRYHELQNALTISADNAEKSARIEEELDGIRQQLATATGNLAIAAGDYNQELEDQIEYERLLAEGQKERAAVTLYDALVDGAKGYRESLDQLERTKRRLAAADEARDQALENSTQGAIASYDQLIGKLDELTDGFYDGAYSAEEAGDRLQELEDIVNAMGFDVDFSTVEAADDFIRDNMTPDMLDLGQAFRDSMDDVAGLQDEVSGLTGELEAMTRKAQDLVNTGLYSIEDVAGLLGVDVPYLTEEFARLAQEEADTADAGDELAAALEAAAGEALAAEPAMDSLATVLSEDEAAARKAKEEILEIGYAAIDAKYSGDNLRNAYEELCSQLEVLREDGDAYVVSLVEQELKELDLLATQQELTGSYPFMIQALEDSGVAVQDLSQYLQDNQITAEEWGQAAERITDNVINGFGKVSTSTGMSLEEMADNLESNIEAYHTWNENIDRLMQAAVRTGDEAKIAFVQHMADMGIGASEQIAAMTEDKSSMKKALDRFGPLFERAAQEGIDGLTIGIDVGTPAVASAAITMIDSALAEAGQAAYNEGYYVGQQTAAGVAAGMTGAAPVASIQSASAAVANIALGAMKDEAKIHSPSELFRKEIGEQIGLGVAEGITSLNSMEAIHQATIAAMTEAKTTAEKETEGFNLAVEAFFKAGAWDAATDYSDLMLGAGSLTEFFQLADKRDAKITGLGLDLEAEGWRTTADLLTDWMEANGAYVEMDQAQTEALVESVQESQENATAAILDRLDRLSEQLQDMVQTIEGLRLYLDTGALVGGVVSEVNEVLGQQNGYDARGI